MDAVADNDTIIVRPGTYAENIDFKGKAFTVTGEQGVDVTVIDGNQAGIVAACTSCEGYSGQREYQFVWGDVQSFK